MAQSLNESRYFMTKGYDVLDPLCSINITRINWIHTRPQLQNTVPFLDV